MKRTKPIIIIACLGLLVGAGLSHADSRVKVHYEHHNSSPHHSHKNYHHNQPHHKQHKRHYVAHKHHHYVTYTQPRHRHDHYCGHRSVRPHNMRVNVFLGL